MQVLTKEKRNFSTQPHIALRCSERKPHGQKKNISMEGQSFYGPVFVYGNLYPDFHSLCFDPLLKMSIALCGSVNNAQF